MASLGSTPGLIIAAGVGAAASVALEPAFEVPRQDAWHRLPNRILDPGTLARLVAQGGVVLGVASDVQPGTAYDEARRQGYSTDKLDRLIYLAQRAPDLALTLELWRRGRFGTPDPAKPPAPVTHAFAKEQIEPQYWGPIADLFNERLSAQAVALGIIRSVLNDPGFFPVNLETRGGVVPAYPVSKIDPLLEALATGFDEERLRVMVASIGRPPGPQEGARAYFRKLIERPDFNRLILEGDTRPEWAQTFLDVSREILTANQYAELQLRGFLTAAERQAKTDQHGMSAEDSLLLYDLLGRSIPEHQIVTGEARGGVFDGPIDTIPVAYLQSLQRGNLRPEYYNLAYANRYSYNFPFWWRALTQAGELTEDEARQILLELGNRPDLATKAAAFFSQPAGGTKKTDWVGRAQSQLWTATHKAYIGGTIDDATAQSTLTALIPSSADIGEVLVLWQTEKNLAGRAGPPA